MGKIMLNTYFNIFSVIMILGVANPASAFPKLTQAPLDIYLLNNYRFIVRENPETHKYAVKECFRSNKTLPNGDLRPSEDCSSIHGREFTQEELNQAQEKIKNYYANAFNARLKFSGKVGGVICGLGVVAIGAGVIFTDGITLPIGAKAGVVWCGLFASGILGTAAISDWREVHEERLDANAVAAGLSPSKNTGVIRLSEYDIYLMLDKVLPQ